MSNMTLVQQKALLQAVKEKELLEKNKEAAKVQLALIQALISRTVTK
jgi:hypothetical protein